MWSIGGLIFLSLCLGVGAWLFFLWSAKSGHYDDVEGPKYRMMDEDEEDEAEGDGKDKGTGTKSDKDYKP